MEQKFYICKHCKNIVAFTENSGVPIVCCGERMNEIIPNTTDAATEKHIPVISIEDGICTVTIGSTEHPMTAEHYIKWVSLETKQGNQRKCLSPEIAPVVKFALTDGDEVVSAYAYCNLHGLWKASI